MSAFREQADIKVDNLDVVLADLLNHMEEHATVTRSEHGALISSPFGTVDIRRRSEGLSLEASAGSPEVLAMIKVFVAEHIFEFAGETASIVWSGAQGEEQTPSHFQRLRVTGAFDVTPRMRRVLFSGERAAALGGEAGYHVRLLFPPNGRPPVWPKISADGRMAWPAGDDELVSRVYTIRSVDAETGEVAIDFALHDHAGPASAWAARARPGDVVGMLGPSGGRAPAADRHLMAGDETALPALARILADLPAEARGVAIIEVQDENEVQDIENRTGVELRWLFRGDARPGSTTLIEDAIRTIPGPAQGEDVFAWIACEFAAAQTIRAHLRQTWQLPKGRSLVTAYWRRGETHGDALELDGEHDD